jgi:hypothetical protein
MAAMNAQDLHPGLSRRDILRLGAAGVAGLALPPFVAALPAVSAASEKELYVSTLLSWCDGLLAHQITGLADPMLSGGLLCPSCGLIHGRCGDAVYPLLWAAHHTGDQKYLRAALDLHAWSERTVSRADGSWVNDLTLSSWQGITVFHAIALAEALEHHGSILDAKTRGQWTDRLARAAHFLDGFMTIETGNINYPVTSSLAFVLCGRLLGQQHLVDRGRAMAHEAIQYFSPNGFLCGEGHPLKGVSAKGCRPVDLGYNVEESLPSLALYAQLAEDAPVRDVVLRALKTHIEFMLPDGGWDNSWGTRNYKWSWWGSRTSDGCQPGLVLMAEADARFREAARRNLEQMAACTHAGLLYGGPDYYGHGDAACIHHTFTHAKALATVLDRASFEPAAARPPLPRDEPYGLRSFAEIGTHLAAVGPWRATVTENDWEYVEHVQSGGSGAGGGHVTGGALSLLYHQTIGPVLTASMTEYQMIEISNQQGFLDKPHMGLTPRIECGPAGVYTSLNDLQATLAVHKLDGPQSGGVLFEAVGRLLSATRKAPESGEPRYRLRYRITESAVEISATAEAAANARLVVPVLARAADAVRQNGARTVQISRPKGVLTVTLSAGAAFDPIPPERTFNLVPGFEAAPLTVQLKPGLEVLLRIEASAKTLQLAGASSPLPESRLE